MNIRQRINGLAAHYAAFPPGINDRLVAVLGKYHGHLVCEHANGSCQEFAQTVLRFARIAEQISKNTGLLANC
jgi:hypothetical protein